MAYLVYCLYFGIPLEVKVKDGAISVDTQELGEYYSALSRIRVSDTETGATVWEAKSVELDGLTPVWKFSLVVGENVVPKEISKGFRTVVPITGSAFVLRPGGRYRIDIWGSSTLHHNSRRFVAPPRAST